MEGPADVNINFDRRLVNHNKPFCLYELMRRVLCNKPSPTAPADLF